MRARTIIIWCALVPQRREKERVAGGGRQQIQREEMAAGQIFEDEQDENKRAYFQQPERGLRHRAGNEKSEQRRQDNENQKRNEGRPAVEIVRNLY